MSKRYRTTALVSALTLFIAGCGARTPAGGHWVLDVEETTRRLTERATADEAQRPALEAEVAATEKEAKELGAKDRPAGLKAELNAVSSPARMKLAVLSRPQQVGPTVDEYRPLTFAFQADGNYTVRHADEKGLGTWKNLEKSGSDALLVLEGPPNGIMAFFWEGRDRLILVPSQIVFKRVK